MISPMDSWIVNRPRPMLPDRLMTLEAYIYYSSDLSCWKADQAEKYRTGCVDTPQGQKKGVAARTQVP